MLTLDSAFEHNGLNIISRVKNHLSIASNQDRVANATLTIIPRAILISHIFASLFERNRARILLTCIRPCNVHAEPKGQLHYGGVTFVGSQITAFTEPHESFSAALLRT
jgi:hypothetical protein